MKYFKIFNNLTLKIISLIDRVILSLKDQKQQEKSILQQSQINLSFYFENSQKKMQQTNSRKTKDSQSNVLSTVLAQFDIQTQVNKMVMRSFDSLMRSNKQAFDFIKQSEHNFIQFEQRLSKAETYYKNIQINIMSKVQLTQNMAERLQQFSKQFWTAMKDNNNDVITMTKRFDQLSVQKRKLQVKLGECEKAIGRLEMQDGSWGDKINEEVLRITDMIKENQLKTQQRFANDTHQLRQLSQNIIQSRSLLQSKSGLLTQLLKDLQVYKNDRPQIRRQLQELYVQLQHRALKLQIIQMRGYVDSRIVGERENVNNMWSEVEEKVKMEGVERKKEVERIIGMMGKMRREVDERSDEIEQKFKSSIQQLSSELSHHKSQTATNIQQCTKNLSSLQSRYQTQLPQVQMKLSQLSRVQANQSHQVGEFIIKVQQLISNVESANAAIQMLMKENKLRNEEMASMKVTKESVGSSEEQVKMLFEKVDSLRRDVVMLETGKVDKLAQTVDKNQSEFQSKTNQLSSSIQQQNHLLSTNFTNTLYEITTIQTSLKKLINHNIHKLQQHFHIFSTEINSLIQNKLDNIQQKLDSLDQMHHEIKHFKEIFKSQLEENQKVNISIAEKLERVMANFTKLKSDNVVKFQQLTADLQRRAAEIKNSLADVDEIKKYLSIVNQGMNLLLAANLLIQPYHPPKDTTTSTFNNSLMISSLTENKDESSSKNLKIISILEGWIFQCDQTQEKVKYRGENFTFSNRIKFFHVFLEYFVKQTEKIKGKILENGRDVFIKVMESNDDIVSHRKRIQPKRKSQLPKLYL